MTKTLAADDASKIIADTLEGIRKERHPTPRALMLLAAALRLGRPFAPEQRHLDSLEILWWLLHDDNGDLISKGHAL